VLPGVGGELKENVDFVVGSTTLGSTTTSGAKGITISGVNGAVLQAKGTTARYTISIVGNKPQGMIPYSLVGGTSYVYSYMWGPVDCNVDNCVVDPCNGGQCVDDVGAFVCNCKQARNSEQEQTWVDMTGKFCQDAITSSQLGVTYVVSSCTTFSSTDACALAIEKLQLSGLTSCTASCENKIELPRNKHAANTLQDAPTKTGEVTLKLNVISPASNHSALVDAKEALQSGRIQGIPPMGLTVVIIQLSQDRNPCDANPCKNGAKCWDRAYLGSPVRVYACSCAPGFSGELCEYHLEIVGTQAEHAYKVAMIITAILAFIGLLGMGVAFWMVASLLNKFTALADRSASKSIPAYPSMDPDSNPNLNFTNSFVGKLHMLSEVLRSDPGARQALSASIGGASNRSMTPPPDYTAESQL
jgi:hypothetical protein